MNLLKRSTDIVHCDDTISCLFNDKVIDFSPSDLFTLQILFKELAMDATEYGTQTAMREMYEAFSAAYNLWEDKRREINE